MIAALVAAFALAPAAQATAIAATYRTGSLGCSTDFELVDNGGGGQYMVLLTFHNCTGFGINADTCWTWSGSVQFGFWGAFCDMGGYLDIAGTGVPEGSTPTVFSSPVTWEYYPYWSTSSILSGGTVTWVS